MNSDNVADNVEVGGSKSVLLDNVWFSQPPPDSTTGSMAAPAMTASSAVRATTSSSGTSAMTGCWRHRR